MRTDVERDTDFLGELLVDEGILTGYARHCTTEVGKRAIDIYNRFEIVPEEISFGDVQDLVVAKGTQIGNAGMYLSHINNTAGVLRSLVTQLEKKHPELDLPHPNTAFAMGLVHDLNATFSNYAKGGQQSKEFDEYLLAKRLGWEKMTKEVAMHSDYLGVIRLMTKGAEFPKQEAYKEMRKILQGEGPVSYGAIQREFQGFIDGKENLPLMLLTIADYSENGLPHFNAKSFDKDYEARSADIVRRYHGKAVESGATPSLLGQALVDGGVKRINGYKDLVARLLRNEPADMEQLRKETPGIYRQ